MCELRYKKMKKKNFSSPTARLPTDSKTQPKSNLNQRDTFPIILYLYDFHRAALIKRENILNDLGKADEKTKNFNSFRPVSCEAISPWRGQSY